MFSSLSHIWSDHRLSTKMKIRLYQTAVCSTLTHACEAWDLTDKIMREVNGFNSRCLHVITKKHYRDTALNPDFDLLNAICKHRLRYLGHILRMDEGRLLKQTLFALLYEVKERPEGSLLHGCENTPLDRLEAKACDRKEWRHFINNYHRGC